MSPVVDLIQANGNTLLGMRLYPAQFVSAFALVVTVVVIVYVHIVLVRGKKA